MTLTMLLFSLPKKSKNEKRLLDIKYFKFNFSVAGLKPQPFFRAQIGSKTAQISVRNVEWGQEQSYFFTFLAMIKYSSPSHLAHFC